jgi:hypothetical protein
MRARGLDESIQLLQARRRKRGRLERAPLDRYADPIQLKVCRQQDRFIQVRAAGKE